MTARLSHGSGLRLPRCPGEVGGDDVGGVPVQAAAGPVIAHRGPRVGVRSGFLHVPQRHSGVQRGGDERVSERVGLTTLAIPARRAVLRTIRAAPCRSSRRPSAARNTGPSVRSPMARSSARAVRGASGMVTILPPLRVMVRVRCPRSRPKCSMSAPAASETRSPFRASREIRACSPAARARRPPAGHRVRCGPAPRHGTRSSPAVGGHARPASAEEFFFDRVPVEPGDGGQPPGDGGAGPAPGFQVPGEALDVGAADGEQGQGPGAAPAGELAQVQRVGLAGQAAVPARNPARATRSVSVKTGWNGASAADGTAVVIGHLPARLKPGSWASPGPSGLTEPQRKPPGHVTLCRRSSGMAVAGGPSNLHTDAPMSVKGFGWHFVVSFLGF